MVDVGGLSGDQWRGVVIIGLVMVWFVVDRWLTGKVERVNYRLYVAIREFERDIDDLVGKCGEIELTHAQQCEVFQMVREAQESITSGKATLGEDRYGWYRKLERRGEL